MVYNVLKDNFQLDDFYFNKLIFYYLIYGILSRI